MRNLSADQFNRDYQYKDAKRDERKADRQRRDARRGGKRIIWKEAE